METLALVGKGFAIAFQAKYLLFCLAGVLMGQIIGALPGIGPSAGISILMPLTFGGDAIGSTIMFAGIYYGAQYGGTITSVLVRIPGESSTVMTSLDGYELAQQGRAGPTLGIAAVASFIAGTLAVVGLMFAAPALARLALWFGPPEYFALVLLGLSALAIVGGSVLKGLIMGVLGLLLATVGIDPQIGNPRFTFGQLWLLDGFDFLILAVAFFGVGEVLAQADSPDSDKPVEAVAKLRYAYPTWEDWKQCRGATLRGGVIGYIIGILPGAGATIASFIAYAVEKKVSKRPEMFGKGAIEAVAAPEAANNSAATGAMVPMFALGIPGSNTTAVMLGALIMFGLRPGPALFDQNPDFIWSVMASMYVGNVMLLIMNLPLVGVFAYLLRTPYALMYPVILALCVIGVYSHSNSVDDVLLMALFGGAGYFMKKYDYPAAPLVLGLVLEPLFENALRQSMTISHGTFAPLIARPITFALLVIALALMVAPAATWAWRRVAAR
jgi:putative tricarboxylic transport membrane protein